ncbi:MAG: hypothetical protein KJ718_00410 [Nanoarchaeota archaeon]|nr:hypothetical protein [Nanoarchaeota archaeon]MBU1051003.1 hypothetical protein [Nanoarchaeota archaeon]MBU1988984.1 hypothetical protein [Nanoarchaeota archaeon]
MSKIRGVVLGLTLSAITGCTALNLDEFNKKWPLWAGEDGLATVFERDTISRLNRSLATPDDSNAFPYVIEAVGCGFGNMDEIRKAHEQDRNILIFGYSSGAKWAQNASHLCRSRGIEIAWLGMADPTYSSFSRADIPNNVRNCTIYFSDPNLNDLVTAVAPWGRGDPSKYENNPRIEVVHIPTTHLGMMNYLRNDLKKRISQHTKND